MTGETPLIHASRQGHFQTAKYLLEQGADPSASGELGATSLHHAAGIGLLPSDQNSYVVMVCGNSKMSLYIYMDSPLIHNNHILRMCLYVKFTFSSFITLRDYLLSEIVPPCFSDFSDSV